MLGVQVQQATLEHEAGGRKVSGGTGTPPGQGREPVAHEACPPIQGLPCFHTPAGSSSQKPGGQSYDPNFTPEETRLRD